MVDIGAVLLDKKYDAEYVHELIRSAGTTSVIPARGDIPVWRLAAFRLDGPQRST